jgi:lysyl-tRNA synthetase class 2
MKRLLAAGSGPVFQITRAFRAGEAGALHNPEFAMLEWYAPGKDWLWVMDETERLVGHAARALAAEGFPPVSQGWPRPFPRVTVDEVFRERAGWVPSRDFDEDRFFDDLVGRVEGSLAERGALFLTGFPAPLAALARLSPDDPLVAERFELYLAGVEICNGFGELTDAAEQEKRFGRANRAREAMGKEPYPVDRRFLEALESGLPDCAGNALGLDRLLMILTGEKSLDGILTFPLPRL